MHMSTDRTGYLPIGHFTSFRLLYANYLVAIQQAQRVKG
jgi:hypothetical protein